MPPRAIQAGGATPRLARNAPEAFSSIPARAFLRVMSAAALLVAILTAQVPLANFSGTVHGVSKKQITIESAEGNLVDFDINRKTKVLRGKTEIKPEDLTSGDVVTIQARQEMLKFLIAVVITVQTPPATQPKDGR
jgi:hypothetical protein